MTVRGSPVAEEMADEGYYRKTAQETANILEGYYRDQEGWQLIKKTPVSKVWGKSGVVCPCLCRQLTTSVIVSVFSLPLPPSPLSLSAVIVSVFLSVCLSVCLSLFLPSLSPSPLSLSRHSVCLSVYQSVCLSVCLFVSVSLSLSLSLCPALSLCLFCSALPPLSSLSLSLSLSLSHTLCAVIVSVFLSLSLFCVSSLSFFFR